ncbi:hypothetical protein NDU88_012296 [Pleurodeles waltl]|uniref:Uncharacterized protein n=1 Tax=Pleurodeles waltl TaxID=8319 RepID=A0AAV7R488_PLEWA|nr:hypothetical protein NDU88_012296 [Pleurodeles waltl]
MELQRCKQDGGCGSEARIAERDETQMDLCGEERRFDLGRRGDPATPRQGERRAVAGPSGLKGGGGCADSLPSPDWNQRISQAVGRGSHPAEKKWIEILGTCRALLGDGVALQIATVRPGRELAHKVSRRLEVGSWRTA